MGRMMSEEGMTFGKVMAIYVAESAGLSMKPLHWGHCMKPGDMYLNTVPEGHL